MTAVMVTTTADYFHTTLVSRIQFGLPRIYLHFLTDYNSYDSRINDISLGFYSWGNV